MATLFNEAIGSGGATVSVASSDDGKLGLQVSYPVAQLEGPLQTLLTSLTAKIPFLQKRVPSLVAGIFAFIKGNSDVASSVVASAPAPNPTVAAAEAPAVAPAQ